MRVPHITDRRQALPSSPPKLCVCGVPSPLCSGRAPLPQCEPCPHPRQLLLQGRRSCSPCAGLMSHCAARGPMSHAPRADRAIAASQLRRARPAVAPVPSDPRCVPYFVPYSPFAAQAAVATASHAQLARRLPQIPFCRPAAAVPLLPAAGCSCRLPPGPCLRCGFCRLQPGCRRGKVLVQRAADGPAQRCQVRRLQTAALLLESMLPCHKL